jgi:hypothetical protein
MRELKVRRLVRRYEQPRPDRRLKSDAAEHAFGILRSTYADFGPTLATESSEPSTASIWPRRLCTG